ncbi:MAG: lipopolysaccharide assembly protein LapB [Burkholderiaceae bacterium]|nr:lipopolysaccharide assembly protein LapB [Burkholderiaceae bacterium]
MDFDLSWILLGLPLAFVLGWVASRFDLRQLRMENRQAPKAYFRGLNFLLNEQQDKAIDAFIEAVQNDPDTSELHFALGNLFRRRGEYERAVRVHEHLLSRGDLARTDRERAQHALALDFLKAGLLDRAEDALSKLEGTPFEGQARLALLAIYERSRDWPQAAVIAQKLEASGEGNFSGRLAHYVCEEAATLAAAGRHADARALLEQAMIDAPQAPRPRIDLAALLHSTGDAAGAFKTLQTLARETPGAVPLVASRLALLAGDAQRPLEAMVLLKESYTQAPSLDVLEAIVTLEAAAGASSESAREWYVKHLEREPSLVAAAKWIAGEKLEHEQFHPQVQRALDHAVRPLTRYRCAACGFEAKQHFWQCPGCQAWDSYPARRVEEL